MYVCTDYLLGRQAHHRPTRHQSATVTESPSDVYHGSVELLDCPPWQTDKRNSQVTMIYNDLLIVHYNQYT